MYKLVASVIFILACVSCSNMSKTASNGTTEIDLDDFDDLELQSLAYLNKDRRSKGIKPAQMNQELMVMAQNEADRLANISNIEPFLFSVNRKMFVNLFRIIGKNKKGERIGLKKCYNLNDSKYMLDFDQVYTVNDECESVSGKEMNVNLITDVGFGRTYDLASNQTLYHVRLFYYSNNLEFDLNSLNGLDSGNQDSGLHKYGAKTGLKYLKIE